MNRRPALLLAPSLLLAACVAPPRDRYGFDDELEFEQPILLQGLLGVAEIEPDLTIDPGVGILPEDGDLTGPLLGGVLQRPYLGGEVLGLGLEGGFTFTWDRSRTEILANGTSILADEEVFLADLFGGAFLNLQGDYARAYAGAGPLLQYGEVEIDSGGLGAVVFDEDGSFGWGGYARVGVEVRLFPGTFIGLGVRWSESELDLSGGLDDLEIDTFQAMLTVTDYGWLWGWY